MKAFFLRYQKLHSCLLAELGLLSIFWLAKKSQAIMDALAGGAKWLRLSLAELCYRVPFSVMELLCILLVLAALGYLTGTVVVLFRSTRRAATLYRALLGVICIGLGIYLGFCYLWGVNYAQPGFQEQSGIYAEDVALEDLDRVTRYFARQLQETADTVLRDENGLFAVPREEILAQSVLAYDAAERQFPFLAFEDPGIKAVYFSGVMSLLDFTGVYCPFTGESNVNMAFPACLLPSTVAHELAHQRGYPSEQECNFLAVLSSTSCGIDAYAYSGWLMGYIYLGNALYLADRESWKSVYASLPETVRADLSDNNAYWAQFHDSGVKKASNAVYDNFLKSYGVKEGMQSYGMVVDLLVAYYKDLI